MEAVTGVIIFLWKVALYFFGTAFIAVGATSGVWFSGNSFFVPYLVTIGVGIGFLTLGVIGLVIDA